MDDCDKQMMKAEHRQKIVETICLFWAFVLIGFDNGILGPCLPDLQSLVGASLEQMSYVFFVQGTGALLGNVLGFLLETRCDRHMLMGVYVLVGSVINILIPLVPSFYYLLALFLLQGITKGQADFGAMSLCNVLWKDDKALPFQFIVVGAGISTFISPFIAQPFISSLPSAPSSMSPDTCQDGGQDSEAGSTRSASSHSGSHQLGLMSNSSLMVSEARAFSDIKWPFVIVGLTTLPAALAFFYFYCTGRKRRYSVEQVAISVRVDSPRRDGAQRPLLRTTSRVTPTPLSRHNKCVVTFRILVILLNVPVFGLLLTFADLLTSIGMTSPLCLTAVQASYFNTVLWGSAMIGRTVSAVILMCVPMAMQLLFNSVALVGVGLVLVMFYYGNSLVLWLGTAGVALFITPAMPGFIAWSGDFVPITPFFMNLCLCAAGVGEMLLPFLGGQLMAMYGSWYMMVFALMTMTAMLVLFLLAAYVARKICTC